MPGFFHRTAQWRHRFCGVFIAPKTMSFWNGQSNQNNPAGEFISFLQVKANGFISCLLSSFPVHEKHETIVDPQGRQKPRGYRVFCCSTPLWGTQTWLLSFLLRGKIPMFFKFPFCWVDVNISIFLHLTCATKSILNTCIAATVLKYVEIIWNHNFYGRSLMDCPKMGYPKTAMLLGRTMIDPLLWTTPPYLIFA